MTDVGLGVVIRYVSRVWVTVGGTCLEVAGCGTKTSMTNGMYHDRLIKKYRVFFYTQISFFPHFYKNKDIDMQSFVTCSRQRVIFV